MRTIARTAAALLTTTIVVGATATSAFAQTTTVKDKASDVVAYADENDENGVVRDFATSVATGADVRSMVVKHGRSTLSVTVKFRSLSRGTAVSAAVRPSGKVRPNRVIVAAAGDRSGEVYNADDKKVCSAKVTTKSGRSGYVKVTVKRSCLGSPKKLRVSAAAVGFDPTTGNFLVDVVSPDKIRTPASTKSLKAS